MTEICGEYTYISFPSNVTYIDLKHTKIRTFCSKTLNGILHNSSVKWLDLSYNNISKMPIEFSTANNIEKLWLEDNPIFCDCEMIWMIDWLGNEGKHIVQNSERITCVHGKEVGKPVYLLRPYDMDCYNGQAGMWIAVGTISIMIIFMVFALGPIVHYVDLRWVVYKKFGILIGNPDENEIIDKMQFDAFLSYR